MASMKFYKPSFNYGASQSNLSKYEHQEEYHNMSQSSHGYHGYAPKPNHGSTYYDKAHGRQMGQSMYGFHHGAEGSAQHYAQAQSVIPTPPIHVQQAQHRMEKDKYLAKKLSINGSNCSSPDGTAPSSGSMMAKMEHGWASKPNQYSSPNQASGYGTASMYNKNSVNNSWAGKPTNIFGSSQVDKSGQMMYAQHKQNGWGNSPTNLPNSGPNTQSNLSMHMMGKMDHGSISSQTQANHSSMHQEEHMTGNMGHLSISGPVKANHSSLSMHQEQHMIGKMDLGWASSPTKNNHSKLSTHHNTWVESPTKANHSSVSMQQEQHTMGKMEHGWAPSNYASANQMNNSGHATHHEEEHSSWAASPIKANHSSVSMQQEQHMMGKMEHGWAPPPTNYASPNQINHSGHAMYNHDECQDENIDDLMDEILNKYPAHNVSNGNGHVSWAAKPSGSMGQSQLGYHHGSTAQSSMAWNERKEKKEAYSTSSSSSSNVNKFGMNGGISNNYVGLGHDDDECHI